MATGTGTLGELWTSRELLRTLVAKELKVRYKGSFLGFLWSLITPLMLTGVYTLVFATFIKVQLPDGDFASFFLSGFLVWSFFSNSVNSSATTIVGNGALIRKVWFPREVLPLSLVSSQAVLFGLAILATSPLILAQRGFHPAVLPAAFLGFALLVLFTAGVSMVFAALNVSFRDLQELTQVLFLAWFYLTPVIYPLSYVRENAPGFLPLIVANPMTWFVELFHTTLYGSTGEPPYAPALPGPLTWLVCGVWAVASLTLGYGLFQRWAVAFAKEI